MSTINFGIDLGTTNSAIAKYGEGEVEVFRNPINLKQTLPSVVAFRKNRIIIGDKAKEVLSKDPENVVGSFKRKMGTADKYFIHSTSETLSAEVLSSYILKELKNFVHTGEQVDAAAITIPASFDTMQSNATKKAGYQAGFQQVVLLQEPIAASLAYANKGMTDLNDKKWLVYDLGGGTFDVALVSIEEEEMKVLDHEGNNYLGGTDFDKAIIEKLIIPHLEAEGSFQNLEKEMKSATGKYNRLFNVLLFKAEEAKILLTNSPVAEIEFEVEDDTGEELDIYLTITREQLNDILQPYINQTIEMIESVLARNELGRNDIQFILMIGGSTYIPAVRESLKNRFEVEINCNIDPTTAVAIGAAFFAGMKIKQVASLEDQAKGNYPKEEPDASSINIRTAFSKVTQDRETAFLATVEGDVNGKFYRITRSDGGYDSGLKPLSNDITEYLPLVPQVFNQFTFQVFDEFNNLIHLDIPSIGIMHGRFGIDGQPLPNDICLEVDMEEGATTYLEPIFKKNAILPVKKTIVKEVSKHIYKGSEEALIINILEGPVDSLPAANKTIGYIKIGGRDLQRDLIRGSDVELTFEISESRDLSVHVYLTISGQEFENVFSPSETHVSLEKLSRELMEFRTNLLRKRTTAEQKEDYRLAASIKELMGEVESLSRRIQSLDETDVTDEKYQIDEAKREVARKMHAFYSKSVLAKTLEEYFNIKSNIRVTLTFNKLATPEDEKVFNNIVANEKSYIATDNVQVISMKTTELKGLMTRINSRKETTQADWIAYFSFLKNHTYQDQRKANDLIKKGEKALDKGSYGTLSDVVNQLHYLMKSEEKDDPNTFKKGGTGLR